MASMGKTRRTGSKLKEFRSNRRAVVLKLSDTNCNLTSGSYDVRVPPPEQKAHALRQGNAQNWLLR